MSPTLTDEGPAVGGPAVAPEDQPASPRALTPYATLKRVVLLFNPMSGSVGPHAEAEARSIFADYAIDAEIHALDDHFDQTIAAAFDSRPDALFVLAGDGTARAVAAAAGPDGPLVAPLPGGTMNMLPKALYDTADWKIALRRALEEGEPQFVAGGRINDHDPFFCAAILGSPALWAPAREALRAGKLKLAWSYAHQAIKRAFSGRLRYSLDDARRRRTGSLALISPVISKAMDESCGLEAAAMDPAGASETLRMAAHALFDDWRRDPAVSTHPARRIAVSARSQIPAVIDGEPIVLGREADIVFLPRAFRTLAPRPTPDETDA